MKACHVFGLQLLVLFRVVSHNARNPGRRRGSARPLPAARAARTDRDSRFVVLWSWQQHKSALCGMHCVDCSVSQSVNAKHGGIKFLRAFTAKQV